MHDLKFTDIHCHIIPQVDDGSDSLKTSLKLVRMMYDDGIRKVITTPHYGVINPSYDPGRVTERYNALKAEVGRIYPDMQLYRGNELFIAPGYYDGLDEGRSHTLADSGYTLVEFDDNVSYETMQREFRKLLLRGYTPVCAHAERYMHAYRNLKGLAGLIDQGILIQVNSSSICKLAKPVRRRLIGGDTELRLLRDMLTEGMIHFIGSDCHDMPGREPHMTEAAEIMKNIIGEERTREILIDNPLMLTGAADVQR